MAKDKANVLMIPAEPGIYGVVFENMQSLEMDIKYIFDNAFVGYDKDGNEIVVIKSKVVMLTRKVSKPDTTT